MTILLLPYISNSYCFLLLCHYVLNFIIYIYQVFYKGGIYILSLQIYNKDSTKGLLELDDNSVDFIVTSPPYWNLVNYDNENQLGYNHSYDEYIAILKKCLDSFIRVLKDDRYIAINIGDVINKEVYNNSKINIIYSIQADIINYLVSKNLFLFRHITWYKPNSTIHTRGPFYGGYFFPRKLYPQLNTEHILVFYKNFSNTISSTECKKRYNEILDRIPSKLHPSLTSSLWEIPTITSQKNGKSSKKNHPAPFPEDIPFRLIKLFTFKGETVLDPFMGKGTSLKMALSLSRNAIGYELNKNYIDIFSNTYIHSELESNDYYKFSFYEYMKNNKSLSTISEKFEYKIN